MAPAWVLIAYLWVCYVLNHADRQVVYTLFPALQKEFGFSDAIVGLTGALFLWVYGLSSPIAGILGDRWSKTKIIVGSLAIWSAFTIISGMSPNGTFLLVCRGLLGVSESLFMPAAYALMAAAHGPASRSKAIAIFGTSQMVGVAIGGSLSGYIADHFHWRVSFFILGGIGLLFAPLLWRFFSTMPASFQTTEGAGKPASLSSFIDLIRIPSVRVVTLFVTVATFGLFLVYTWLPTFLYDKFSLSQTRAGFEASVYPQIGTLTGLVVGGTLADRYYNRLHSARFWIVLSAFIGGGPCIYLIGSSDTLALTRLAAIAFGFFAGFVSSNQAACSFDVVPARMRASTIGVLNLLGATVSGFAPFFGGLARRTIGVNSLMTYTSIAYFFTALILLYGILRYFKTDHERAATS